MDNSGEAGQTQETTTEKMLVNETDYKEIMSVVSEIERAQNVIGSMETRKFEIVSEIQNMRHNLDQKAKQSLLNKGIAEADLEKYMVDLKSGEIISR